jgi:chaperonin GroEL
MIYKSFFRLASSKRIIFGSDCKDVIASTAQHISRTVGITLGPMGRFVMIEDSRGGVPRVTKDGVTVAKHIEYV